MLLNPPTPPPAPLPPPIVRIDGPSLVVPKNFELPRVCVLTGATEDLVPMKRTLYWHPPALYLTVFIGLPIYVIVALVMRKSAKIRFQVARAERSRRRRWHALNWIVFLLTFGSLAIAGSTGRDAFFGFAPLCLVASLVIYFTRVRLLHPQMIDDHVVALRGIPAPIMRILAGFEKPAPFR